MTVTLSPELADLLSETGHTWPAADEDHLTAMASGWRDLGVGLHQIRADHLDTTRSVLAAGSGEGIAAFGDWGADLAALLLPLVEACARVEAWLIRIADWFYETKTAILRVLDDLGRRIEELRRDAAEVPVIGAGLEAGVEKVLEPCYTGARLTISNIVNGFSEAVVDLAVPGLVTVIEWIKGAIQGLRKLIRFEWGADWPTTPSDYPNPTHRPRGPLAKPHPNDKNPVNARSLRLENEAAATLAQAGYDIEQKPTVPGAKEPDYRIDGKIFDCVSPTASSAYSIWSNIKKKKVDVGQTERVIIDINAPDAQASVGDLRRQFQDNPMPGLKEAKVIAPGGAIIDIYP